jgi:hypothetical protein
MRRAGQSGAMGPKPTGGSTSRSSPSTRSGGPRLGTGTRPQPSARASLPMGIPAGFAVSGPPAARSQTRGMRLKRAGAERVPSSLKWRSPVTWMALSTSPTESRASRCETGASPGATACPTRITSGWRFHGTASDGTERPRAGSPPRCSSASHTGSWTSASGLCSGASRKVALQSTVSAWAPGRGIQRSEPTVSGERETTCTSGSISDGGGAPLGRPAEGALVRKNRDPARALRGPCHLGGSG